MNLRYSSKISAKAGITGAESRLARVFRRIKSLQVAIQTAMAMRSHLDALSMVAGLEMGLTVWITAFIVRYRSEEDSNPAA